MKASDLSLDYSWQSDTSVTAAGAACVGGIDVSNADLCTVPALAEDLESTRAPCEVVDIASPFAASTLQCNLFEIDDLSVIHCFDEAHVDDVSFDDAATCDTARPDCTAPCVESVVSCSATEQAALQLTQQGSLYVLENSGAQAATCGHTLFSLGFRGAKNSSVALRRRPVVTLYAMA